MAGPDTKMYSEPSVRTLAAWSPAAVRSVLTQLQRGDFSRAGILADAVLADDRVQAVIGTRINGLLSLPLAFEAADDTPKAAQVAELLEADWWEIGDEALLSEWLAYALLLGACAAELVWDTSGERSLPRLRVWHPSNLKRDEDAGTWSVRLAGDKWQQITPGDGKWALLAPFGERRAGTRALLRAVAVPWLSKTYATGDWNRYSELHGSGTRVGKAPTGATPEERRSFRNDLAGLANDSAIVLPPGWELELLEAKVGSGDVFEKLISWADKAMAISILGQNLTTDVEGGSLAAAEVHERVRYDLVANDAELLATATHDQVVVWWTEFNVGDRALAPWPDWDAEPPTDEAAVATALGERAQALLTLSTAQLQTGLPIDWVQLAGRLDIPLIEGAPLQPPRHPDPEQQLAAGRVRLASGDSLDSARGFARGQLYADRVADAARAQASDALAPALQDVMRIIADANGYDELRQRLLAAYSGLAVDDLADLTESSVVLASLAGRLAVLDDAGGE